MLRKQLDAVDIFFVKLAFFQDKLLLLRHARQKLEKKGFFLVDDLTLVYLAEKRELVLSSHGLFLLGLYNFKVIYDDNVTDVRLSYMTPNSFSFL